MDYEFCRFALISYFSPNLLHLIWKLFGIFSSHSPSKAFKMKYSFTTTALVGVILAVTSSGAPISQQTSSSTISTPSFGPQYHTTARGPFTAFAVSETHAPASYRTYDFHGFGLGQVVPETPLPVVSTSRSTSVKRTPTKMHVTGSSTPTALFPNFHPHFGHGPVVSGRGSKSSHRNSNLTK